MNFRDRDNSYALQGSRGIASGATTSAGSSSTQSHFGLWYFLLISWCRHLSFVRNSFGGTPTLVKETISANELRNALDTTDIL
jgi:hypothetical protein